MSNIKCIKLLSGADLIADVVETTDPIRIELKDPASIIMQKTEHGIGVALAPFMPYAVGNVSLDLTGAAMGTPDPQLCGEYNKLFGVIQIAPASVLNGLHNS